MAQAGLAIALPFEGRNVHPLWAVNLSILDFPQNTAKSILMVQKQPIDIARNKLVEMALERKNEYIFFLDDDVVCPRFTVMALGDLLEKGRDEGVMVATGIYCTKSYAPAPVLYKDGYTGNYWDWTINQQFEVDGCGAGCMLINTKVFENLEPPYFKFTQQYEEKDGEQNLIMVSEDIYFCRKVRSAGYKIKAHGAVLCEHYNNADEKFYRLPEDSRPYKRELKRQQDEVEKQKEVNTNG